MRIDKKPNSETPRGIFPIANPTGIVVFGGINMDLVTLTPHFPKPGETIIGSKFLTYPGGKGANQAIGCARLGTSTYFVGRVGSDIFGSQLVESFKAQGVDTSRVRLDPHNSSGIAVINIDNTAQNIIIQISGANMSCDMTETRSIKELFQNASVLMLTLEVPPETTLLAAKQFAARGRQVILDPAPVTAFPAELYKYCNYITPNETEATKLVGFSVTDISSAQKATTVLLERGVHCAIIKMGHLGCYYSTNRGESEHVPAYKIKAIDSVAAGDAFNAGLAVALSENKTLRESIDWANAAGAISVTKIGSQDSMPNRYNIEKLLSQNP